MKPGCAPNAGGKMGLGQTAVRWPLDTHTLAPHDRCALVTRMMKHLDTPLVSRFLSLLYNILFNFNPLNSLSLSLWREFSQSKWIVSTDFCVVLVDDSLNESVFWTCWFVFECRNLTYFTASLQHFHSSTWIFKMPGCLPGYDAVLHHLRNNWCHNQ